VRGKAGEGEPVIDAGKEDGRISKKLQNRCKRLDHIRAGQGRGSENEEQKKIKNGLSFLRGRLGGTQAGATCEEVETSLRDKLCTEVRLL